MTGPLTMPCLSGFELYSRWVPLVSGWRFPCELAHFNSSQKERLQRLHCSFMTHFMLTRPQSSLLRKERSARGETTGDESAFYDTFYNAIRVFSFHCCWLDQKFIIQRTHSFLRHFKFCLQHFF